MPIGSPRARAEPYKETMPWKIIQFLKENGSHTVNEIAQEFPQFNVYNISSSLHRWRGRCCRVTSYRRILIKGVSYPRAVWSAGKGKDTGKKIPKYTHTENSRNFRKARRVVRAVSIFNMGMSLTGLHLPEAVKAAR